MVNMRLSPIQIPRNKCIDVGVIESPVRPCKCKDSVKLGLGKDRDGILIAPHVLNKVRKGKDMRGFSKDFKAALDQHPKLGDILNQSKRSDGKPHYYMAYKHTEDAFGEFVALAGYMEEDEQDFWVLSNMDESTVNHPVFKKLLRENGIANVVFHTQSYEVKNISLEENPSGKTAHLVHLPLLVDNQYTALFALSEEVVGVTSNQSLFLAITLNKLPIYSPFAPFQERVNPELAKFGQSVFAGVFKNEIDPYQKALIAKQNIQHLARWRKDIMTNKVVNRILVNKTKNFNRAEGSGYPAGLPDSNCRNVTGENLRLLTHPPLQPTPATISTFSAARDYSTPFTPEHQLYLPSHSHNISSAAMPFATVIITAMIAIYVKWFKRRA
ncbi:hypothetical protein [Endozoicomonas sp. Mp262]|uniref:hypothetical protein n=1 Tax=Endozoicomonas sp. Mp262 TaxID=2919499 RepID=UPI0021D98332